MPSWARHSVGVDYGWNLRQVMASREMFATTDLLGPLAQRGIRLSSSQVYRLVVEIPRIIGDQAQPITQTRRLQLLRRLLRSELPAIALEEYAEPLDTFAKGLAMNAKNAIAPEVVAKAVEHALTAKRPRTRYLVGKDAKAVGTLGRILPDRALDTIVAKITKLT